MDTVIYQRDGATPHCSNASLEYFHRCLPGDRLISLRTGMEWTTLGLHILYTYHLCIIFCGDTKKTGSMLTTPSYWCAQK